ncbi:MAG TPA: YlcI/YnfO family protein [Wenzhouxiangella sp.]|nr:YlcI/YnfO family protein [Wenzhouxiangella sp.]
MKTSNIPSLRVTPEFRHEVENALHEGESLSAFLEASLRQQIERRKTQKSFVNRGLAARETAKSTGRYVSKDELMNSLQSILEAHRDKE